MKSIGFILIFISSIVIGQDIKVTSDFPGGNILISSGMSGDTIILNPDWHLSSREWFHWYFKVSNIADKKVTFMFEQDQVFGKYGPAYSINNDKSWKWYGENRIENNGFTYKFNEKDTIAYFSVSMPYTEVNFQAFYSKLNNAGLARIDTLCFSKENRVIEKILISPPLNGPKHRVVITARHHASETSANYVLEGIIESILNESDLEYLRNNIEFLIVPFMDKDGVENGEQGKRRIPRDHNRDYDSISIHRSTNALRTFVPHWGGGKVAIALDIHSPYITGEGHEVIHLVGSDNFINQQSEVKFSRLLEKNSRGEMKSYHTNFLPYGESWNTAGNVTEGSTFSRWGLSLEGILLSTTLEVPYANISGVPFSKDGARIYGKAVAYSIMEYLMSKE